MTQAINTNAINPINPAANLTALSPTEALTECLSLPWDKRLTFLENFPDIRELINIFPAEELFWTIKSAGPKEAVSILPYVSSDTIQFFFDLDCWKKDEFLPLRALTWIVLMFEAGDECVLNWLKRAISEDEAIIPLILRSFIDVHKRDDSMDIQEANDLLPPFTLDNCYYIKFKNIELQPVWGRLIAIIFNWSQGQYRDIMESILWETGIEQMEYALRWRNGRLYDQGIPPYYEAIDIFAVHNDFWPRKIAPCAIDIVSEANPDLDWPMPLVPTIYTENAMTLQNALLKLVSASHMERVISEWIGLSNKLIAAKLVDLDEPQILHDTLVESASLINLGLELISEKEGLKPYEVLQEFVLEDIVKLAFLEINKSISDVKRLKKDLVEPPGLDFLPDTLKQHFEALFNKPPRLWDEASYGARPFSALKDIEVARELGEIACSIRQIIMSLTPPIDTWQKSLSFEGTNLNHIKELDIITVIFTQIGLDPMTPIAPVSISSIPHIINVLKEIAQDKGDSDALLKKILCGMYPCKAREDSGSRKPLRIITKGFKRFLIKEIKAFCEEFDLLPSYLDPRLITKIWIRHE